MSNKESVVVTLKIITNLIKRTIRQSVDYNLTDNQIFILVYVFKNQNKRDIFQKDIEKVLDIRRSTTTEILQIMERDNLIKRVSTLDDKRVKKIILSEKGFYYVKQFERNFKLVETQLLAGVEKNELADFFMVLEKMKNNLNNIKYWDEEELC